MPAPNSPTKNDQYAALANLGTELYQGRALGLAQPSVPTIEVLNAGGPRPVNIDQLSVRRLQRPAVAQDKSRRWFTGHRTSHRACSWPLKTVAADQPQPLSSTYST